MPGFSNSIFLVFTILAPIVALFLTQTPMTAPTKQWADGPCPLVQTPQFVTKKTDIFTTGATHMAHIHNAILRGYNSIYLQAPHVTHEDKVEFIGYSQSWFRFVKSHHDDEEAELFPKVEEVLGKKGIWEETHKEHESFLSGLAAFNSYLENLGEPYAFDGKELLKIMDSFQEPFCHHFHHEIETIASFAELPEAKNAEAAAGIFKAWGKKTVTKAGTTDVVPFFLLNLDATYEDGMWANWPPMPAPIRWGLVNIAGAYHWGRWKFASCDAKSMPRELYALQFPENNGQAPGTASGN
jgi:hemerythrin-like domain-containing protein